MKRALTIGQLEEIWRFSIEPYIEDQFYGQADQISSYRWDAVRPLLNQPSNDGDGEADPAPGAADPDDG